MFRVFTLFASSESDKCKQRFAYTLNETINKNFSLVNKVLVAAQDFVLQKVPVVNR